MNDQSKLFLEAREEAKLVLSGHTRSHVAAARVLAEFVMQLPELHTVDGVLQHSCKHEPSV